MCHLALLFVIGSSIEHVNVISIATADDIYQIFIRKIAFVSIHSLLHLIISFVVY